MVIPAFNSSHDEPPRPRKLSVRVVQTDEGLAFSRRRGEPGGGFLLLWLIGWTVGCVALAAKFIANPDWFTLLFALPFWASWLFAFSMVVKMFFQVEQLVLGVDGAMFARRAIVNLNRRTVPLREIRGFRTNWVAGSEGSGHWQIVMLTSGETVVFFDSLPPEERDWIVFQLNRCLEALGGGVPNDQESATPETPVEPEDDDETDELDDEKPDEETDEDDATVEPSVDEPVEPPSDSIWRRYDEVDAFALVSRGRFALATVGVLLFINVFWNGIVSVFLAVAFGFAPAGPQGAERWGLLVFLIPFEVIGLAMIVALLATVAEPIRRTIWRFDRGEIGYRLEWLGVGYRRAYPVGKLRRVELRKGEKGATAKSFTPISSPGRDYRLLIIDDANAELCTIGGLTRGEAQWMAALIRRERPDWFRS